MKIPTSAPSIIDSLNTSRIFKISGLLFLVSGVASLIFTSQATLITLLAIVSCSLYVAIRAKDREILQGVLTPLPAMVVLQIMYFADRGGYYPIWMLSMLFIGNLLFGAFVGCIAGLIAKCIHRLNRPPQMNATQPETLSRIFSSIIAVTFIIHTVIVACSPVLAQSVTPELIPTAGCDAEVKTPNDLLKPGCYDSTKTYDFDLHQEVPAVPHLNSILPPSLQYLYSQYPDVDPQTVDRLYRECTATQGCNFQTTLQFYHNSLTQNDNELPQGVIQNCNNNNCNKHSSASISQTKLKSANPFIQFITNPGAFVDNVKTIYHSYKKSVTHINPSDSPVTKANKLFMGVRIGIYEVAYSSTIGVASFLINARNTAINHIIAHPLQTFQAITNGTVAVAKSIGYGLTHPIKTIQNISSSIASTWQMGNSLFHQASSYGWINMARDFVFSTETVHAWRDGEYGVAIGRGATEFAILAASFVNPETAVMKLGTLSKIGTKLAQTSGYIRKVQEIAPIIVEGIKKNPEALQVIKELPAKIGLKLSESKIGTILNNPDFLTVTTRITQTDTGKYSIKVLVDANSSLFKSGNSYNNLYGQLALAMTKNEIRADEAEKVIETAAKDPVLKEAVSDSAGEATRQVTTEVLAKGSATIESKAPQGQRLLNPPIIITKEQLEKHIIPRHTTTNVGEYKNKSIFNSTYAVYKLT